MESSLTQSTKPPSPLDKVYRIFDEVPFAVAFLNGPSLIIDYINQYNLNIWQCKKEDVWGKPLFEAKPDIRSTAGPIHNQVYETGQRFKAEEVPISITTNGMTATCYFNIIIDPVFDDDGKITGQLATFIEVTEQVLARKKVEESATVALESKTEAEKMKRLYEAVTGSTPDLVFVFDLNYRFTYVNPALLSMWGATWEGVIGKGLRDLGYEEWHARLHEGEIDEIVATKKTIRGTVSYNHAQQGKRIYDYIFSPVINGMGEVEAIAGISRDITDQAIKEQVVTESEERFRVMADAAPNMVWALNPDGSQKYVNKFGLEYLGLTAQEAIQFNWTPFIHPDDLEATEAALSDALQHRKLYSIEHRILKNNGEYRWFFSQAAPSYYANGELYGYVGSGVDITERKQLEEKVREQFEELENIYRNAPIGLALIDQSLCFQRINSRLAEINGKLPEEHIGRNLYEVVPDIASQAEAIFRQVLATGKPMLHVEIKGQTEAHPGVERIWDESWYPIKNEKCETIAVSVVVEEITERRKAEDALRKSEEQHLLALEGAELGTYDFFPQTGTVVWSAKIKELFGLPPEAEVDYNVFLKGLHPDDKEGCNAAVQKAMQPENGGLYENEYRTIGITDGKLRWVRSKGRISFDEEGRPVRFAGVVQDITAQKEALAFLQLQSLVIQRMDEGVSISDENGIIRFTNPAEDAMFGYSTGELLGKHVSVQNNYEPEENNRIVSSVMAQLKEKGFWSGEWHNRKKDGTPFFTHAFITSLTVEGEVMFVCVQRDVTTEKLAAESLTYRKALLEAQNEAIPDALLIVDTKGSMISYNKHFATIWNIPQHIVEAKDDTAALKFAMTQVVDPQAFIDRVNYCYQHPEEVVHEEVLFKDGRIIERYGNAVVGEDGITYGWIWYFRDVTERKKAEQAIRESESRFQNLVREASVGIILHSGPEMKVDIVNEAYGRLIDRTPEELLGRNLFSVIPEAEEAYLPILLNVLQSGEAVYLNDSPYAVKKDGRTIEGFLNISLQPYRDKAGNVTGVLALCHDITESVKAKKALQESEARFRQMANSLPIVVWTAAPDGNLTFISQQWEEDYGNPVAKSLGTGWASFVHADDVADAAARWAESLQTGNDYETEFRVRHKSGVYRWILVRAVPIRNAEGTIISWYGSNTDIEDQRKGQEQVKISEARFRTLAETLPQMIWMRTNDGIMEFASQSWERYSGITDIKEAWKWMTHPDDWSIVMSAWEKAVATQKAFRHEVRLKNKEGVYRWHNASGEPLKGEDGTVLKWIGALTDIHEQKTFSEKLEKEVEERTKQLAQANKELQRSNEDLQQFAHVASHDLKEPVRKVMTFSNRLKDELRNNLSEKGATYLSKIESSALRMYAMIDGVLLYSSLNALEQTKELIDLAELMQVIEADLEVSITEKNATIIYSDLPGIEGSSILLYQLFYNLVNNSLKFAREGVPPVITLTAKKATDAEIIHAGLQDSESYWKIDVADNGIGFSDHSADKIFNSFTRLHTKDKYEGTGLGLSLCRKITERHKGLIYATGKEGEGAVFSILLPVG